MWSSKLLAIYIIYWSYTSETIKKTGIQFNVRGYTYKNDLSSLECVYNNASFCRIIIYIKDFMENNKSFFIISESPRWEAETTFTPPSFKEYILNEADKITDLTDVVYATIPKKKNNLIFGKQKYIDTVLQNFYDNFFEVNCNPCISSLYSLFSGYMRIKYFLVSINEKIRHVSILGVNIFYINNCKVKEKSCIGVITNGACPGLETKFQHAIIVIGDIIPPKNRQLITPISKNENFKLIILSEYNIFNLALEINKVGLGIYAGGNINNCVDDIIWAYNFNKNPYELYTNFNSTGPNGQSYGFTVFYVGAYRYGGINSRYKCEIKNYYQKCMNSSLVSCADKFKSGENCQIDISTCQQEPCKNGGKCHGHSSNYYCECREGSYGKNCEKFTCKTVCNKSICSSPNKCDTCAPGYSGNNCNKVSCENFKKCTNGVCEMIGNTRICSCSRSQFDGTLCQHECVASCVNGLCSFTSGISSCICIPGYYGVKCDRNVIINPKIIQKSSNFDISIIIYAAISFLIIMIIFLFQIFYIRTNINNEVNNTNKLLTSMPTKPNQNLNNMNQTSYEENSKYDCSMIDYDNNDIYNQVDPSEMSDSSSEQVDENKTENSYDNYSEIASSNRHTKSDKNNDSSGSSVIEKSIINNIAR